MASPAPLEGGLLLASKPKGIYKPKGLDYAVSIRLNVGSPYDDGTPVPTPGGGWLLSYHQEGASPADRDRLSANRATRCIQDQIPWSGVMQALGPARHRSQYRQLGLALPVRWANGHFFLQSMNPPGDPGTDMIADTLEAATEPVSTKPRPPISRPTMMMPALDLPADSRPAGPVNIRRCAPSGVSRAMRDHRMRRRGSPGS